MFISNSAEETLAFGERAGRRAAAGEVFALTGDLGAGKTQFVKGFVAGVGGDAEVTSPTFTLLHEYSGGRVPVYHFDFYRLSEPAEVIGLGFDDYASGDGICLIEWADQFRQLLPEQTQWVAFRVAGETVRTVEGLDA